jgi:hypothetical protein
VDISGSGEGAVGDGFSSAGTGSSVSNVSGTDTEGLQALNNKPIPNMTDKKIKMDL